MCAMMQKLRVSSMDMGSAHYAGAAGQVNGTGRGRGVPFDRARRCYKEGMAKLISRPGRAPIAHELTEELVTIGAARTT